MQKARTLKGGRRGKLKFAALTGVLGPGLLAALADNDAGGVISYAVTGAKFGIGIFIPATLCLVLLTYTVQEMAMRLGVATSKGYTHLVKEKYGKFWMGYQVVSLFVENLITLMTEFIGMSAGLVILGLPLWAAVVISVCLVLSIALYGGYAKKEKIALGIGMLNVVFIVVAFLTKPDFSAIGAAFVQWNIPKGGTGELAWYLVALIGNAIAPWMIFYQNSAYVDKGVKSEGIRNGRLDTLAGCVCQVLIAVFIILIGASIMGQIPAVEDAGPAEMIAALSEKFGPAPALLFGLGLFDAGLLAAITVSLSSSWSVAEAFGWSKSLDDKISEAPGFYAVYFISVLAAAGAVLIPDLPLNHLSVMVQVIAGILMTPILIFLTLLTSNRSVMREYRNTRLAKFRAWLTVGILILVSLVIVGKLVFIA